MTADDFDDIEMDNTHYTDRALLTLTLAVI